MSDAPTFVEGTNGDSARRRPSEAPTRREAPGRANASTRRESRSGGDAPTRRETPLAAPSARTRRLNLPEAVDAVYEYVYDLPHSGGEADIALLRDKDSGKQVVFKYYRSGIGPDPMAISRLIEAGRTDEYAHVVEIIDFHHEADGTWEIQEYCAPGSLSDWVAAHGGTLDKQTLKSVVRETAEALQYLHSLGSGIAHRDLKPGNVLVRSEDKLDLVLADFGLAKAQQAFTHLTTTVKGTWHYAAPEVHQKQSSAKSDWFSLGAMIYEFYAGRKLFAMDDGTEVTEDDARARCLGRTYATDLVDDRHWKLLVDGLLTWDKDRRWGAPQVNAWLAGESPPVHDTPATSRTQTQRPTVSYRPNWSPTLIHTPSELADLFRRHWGEAATELAGRPDAKMIRFLKGFPDMDHAVRIIESAEEPGPKLVRLQALLDPEGPIHYDETPLDDDHIRQRIKTGDAGDASALDWLESVVKEQVLSAYAEITHSDHASRAAYLLDTWRAQADAAAQPLPDDYQRLAHQAFRTTLPALFTRALAQTEPTS